MHLRRAMLLMALVLGVVALVGALVPVPRERGLTRPPTVGAPPLAGAAPVRTIRLRFGSGGRPRSVRVGAGDHLVIEVATSAAGEASIPGLGLVLPADPNTPARFDLLATGGAFDVTFAPAANGGGPASGGTGRVARVGRLVVPGSG